jgi:DNA-binding NarL/FixJ family response regulator
MKRLRILLADDHDFVRQGLAVLIELQPLWRVCGEARSGPEAVQKAASSHPDIAVVDYKLPGCDGFEVTRQIKKLLPSCEVLIFTGIESDDLIRETFASGAKSFLLKTDAKTFLIEALNCLAEHRPFFTDKASAVLFARYSRLETAPEDGLEENKGRLSRDEQKLVRLLADGLINEDVARKLRVSVRTVENRRAAIMRKLNLSTFADLVRHAVRNGIIKA